MSKLRKLSIVLLVALSLNLFAIPSYAITLWVDFIQQEEYNWCWAATSLMTGEYMYPSSTATQSSIVYHVKGSIINDAATVAETAHATEYVTNDTIPFVDYYYAFSFNSVKGYINAGVPVQALVHDGGPMGHCYVVYGYYESETGQYLYIVDPWTGYGLYAPYQDFLEGAWSNDSRPWIATVA